MTALHVTPATLTAARDNLAWLVPDPTVRAVLLEALSLTPYTGNDAPGRRTPARRDVPRTPDDLLGVITVPRAAGGRAVVS